MTKFIGSDSHIHNIARGLLVQGDNIILCYTLDDDEWYFLPGGHIEDGESARKALSREIEEELSQANFEISDFIGVCESIFSLDDGKQHEINIVFTVKLDGSTDIDAAEDHIDFVSVPKDELSDYNVLPESLLEGVLEWGETDDAFFKEA
jgi:ADP-ribose pyrophosphatase YjhB (NUDIX family)